MSTRTVAECRDIDAYIADLDRTLRGPRRAKRSLLTEARDGLVDAAEAYERAGLDGPTAARRAVTDFGAIPEIAPGYQAELGAAQSRRTALAILAVLALQIVAWDHPWPLLPEQAEAPAGSSVGVVDAAIEWTGAVCLLAAIALLFGARFGARRPRLGVHLGRATGALGWIVGSFLVASAAVLNTLSPTIAQTPIVTTVVPVVLVVILPVTWMVRSSRRCLALA